MYDFLVFSEMVTNTLYIQGGMNETHIMSDFWKFDLLRKTWERLPQSWPSYSYSTLTDYPYLTGTYFAAQFYLETNKF